MSRVPVCVFSLVAAGAAVALPAYGQAVISTRSGLVHFFEGAVFVAGQPLQARLGRFTAIPEGAELRTAQGRAEVLLTPGVFLRIGENSAIRMVNTALPDTRVELLSGAAIVDATEPAPGTSVTLVYKDWNVHQSEKGTYRLDCQPPRLRVREGQVQVSTAAGPQVSVEQGMDLPFAAVLVPEKSPADDRDALSDWADGRAQSISADNAISAGIQDPASLDSSVSGLDLPGDSFTYFPIVGFPLVGSSLSDLYGSSYPSSLYGSLTPIQSGFYSIYLPGYTYRPMFLRLPSSTGFPGALLPSYRSTGIYRSTYPGSSPITRLPVTRPITPLPHVGVHAIGHR